MKPGERATLQPHVVYISQTSHLKVGVTRATKCLPAGWIRACGAIVVANAPYRQLAGEMEVALKHAFSDRTNWRNMLRETRWMSHHLWRPRKTPFMNWVTATRLF